MKKALETLTEEELLQALARVRKENASRAEAARKINTPAPAQVNPSKTHYISTSALVMLANMLTNYDEKKAARAYSETRARAAFGDVDQSEEIDFELGKL